MSVCLVQNKNLDSAATCFQAQLPFQQSAWLDKSQIDSKVMALFFFFFWLQHYGEYGDGGTMDFLRAKEEHPICVEEYLHITFLWWYFYYVERTEWKHPFVKR